jgi:hypothetical protein
MTMALPAFFRLTGAFLVGVVSLLVALLIFAMFMPALLVFFGMMLPFLAGAMLILAVVLILWTVIYFITMIGVGVYYAIMHPMHVNRAHGTSYSMGGVSEAGVGGKGSSLASSGAGSAGSGGKGSSAAHPHHAHPRPKPLKAPMHPSKKAEHAARKAAKRRAAKKKR